MTKVYLVIYHNVYKLGQDSVEFVASTRENAERFIKDNTYCDGYENNFTILEMPVDRM